MNKKQNFFIFSSLLCFLILTSLFLTGFLSQTNLKLTDQLYGSNKYIQDIVIIAIDDKSLEEIGTWPWSRNNFTLLLTKLNDSKLVIFDISFFRETPEDIDFAKQILTLPSKPIMSFEYLKIIDNKGVDPIYPTNKLLNVSLTGYVNIFTDIDGTIRKLPLKLSNQSALSIKAYNQITNLNIDKEELNINFIGPPNTFKYYSFIDVLNQNISFRNKIVFIGASSPTLNDNHFVPTSNGIPMPGVEIHANALNTLLTKTHIEHTSYLTTIFLILLTIIFISTTLYLTKIKTTIILSILSIVLYFFISISLFSKGLILNLVYVPLTIILTLSTQTLILHSLEKKHKQELISAFQKYVSKEIVNQIVKNPDKIKFGGEKRNLTILFTDIRGFTSISEKLSPEELVNLLNNYLSQMTNVILKNKGLVDKFIGDAIMALWGTPLDNPNSEEDACITALEMIQELNKFNKTQKNKLNIGIGINSGDVIVGNLGSNERFDYTAIGDDVNTASRYESLTKYYGVNILVGEKTHNKVKTKFLFRELDLVAVKGKSKFTKIFQLLEKTKENEELVEKFSEAIEKYRTQKWNEAINSFQNINDEPSKLFIERCKNFQKTPPPCTWKGEHIMESK
ncbi:MAG: adenylate/guanylate cyclase domain-containing protein [Candidatus Nanoarchaeia archaeon]|nr:adenylate/guanylate cyclase domain-containing protein [Candidatus Nanoarchaeia archaeon]